MYSQMIKYVRSFIGETQPIYNWTSVLLCFVDGDKVVMDKGLIILGDVSADFYAHYIHYKNFTILNDELHYMYPDRLKKINPEKVYLHVRVGSSPSVVQVSHLHHWHLYTTSPNNRFFKSIEFNVERVTIVNEGVKDGVVGNVGNGGKKVKVEDIKNPLFFGKQAYNDSCVMFSGINIRFLEN
jgi:hypothetical protein